MVLLLLLYCPSVLTLSSMSVLSVAGLERHSGHWSWSTVPEVDRLCAFVCVGCVCDQEMPHTARLSVPKRPPYYSLYDTLASVSCAPYATLITPITILFNVPSYVSDHSCTITTTPTQRVPFCIVVVEDQVSPSTVSVIFANVTGTSTGRHHYNSQLCQATMTQQQSNNNNDNETVSFQSWTNMAATTIQSQPCH